MTKEHSPTLSPWTRTKRLPPARRKKNHRAVAPDPHSSCPRHLLGWRPCRHVLELYAQLNDSEFLYVTDLQNTYDEARCFFWVHARAEVLRSLTDITYTVRFLALARWKYW